LCSNGWKNIKTIKELIDELQAVDLVDLANEAGELLKEMAKLYIHCELF